MAEALILEFGVATPEDYNGVNTRLGIDPVTGEGDWPDGLVSHTGSATQAGGLLVFEVWDSKESQASFMESRMGPALHEAGLPEPSRVEWLTLLAHRNP